MLKRFSWILPFLSVMVLSTAAQAGVNMGMGAKFAWDNYKTNLMVMEATDAPSALPSTFYASPRFGGQLQLGLLDRRLVLGLDLDLGIFSHTVFPYVSGDELETKVKFIKFKMGLDAKFHLMQPETGKATAYVFLGLGKMFGKANAPAPTSAVTDDDVLDWDASLEVLSKLSSPMYFQLGVGAEFFATDAFSVGADIFGFRMEFAKADVGQTTGFAGPEGSGLQKYVNFYMYSSLNINFTFGGSSKSSGEADQPAPVDAWGTPAAQPADAWGTTPSADGSAGWGTTAPAYQPTPAPAPEPAYQPTPAPPAPEPAPAPAPAPKPRPAPPASGGGGWNTPPPPPPAPAP